MKLLGESLIEIKKSKFIGYFYEIDNEDEAKKILDNLKIEHKKARHIPYAYKVLSTARKSDDKEPTNTAGLPLYNLLEMRALNNVLIAVVRYFGGTKLGASNLLRAYLDAAKEAINANEKRV